MAGLYLNMKCVSEPLFVFFTQTLRYLAELSPNIPIMKNELGMMVSLENLIERCVVCIIFLAHIRACI